LVREVDQTLVERITNSSSAIGAQRQIHYIGVDMRIALHICLIQVTYLICALVDMAKDIAPMNAGKTGQGTAATDRLRNFFCGGLGRSGLNIWRRSFVSV
jgi:hypothetical protein